MHITCLLHAVDPPARRATGTSCWYRGSASPSPRTGKSGLPFIDTCTSPSIPTRRRARARGVALEELAKAPARKNDCLSAGHFRRRYRTARRRGPSRPGGRLCEAFAKAALCATGRARTAADTNAVHDASGSRTANNGVQTSMKAPDLGCRGFVDNSPLISCEGVGERHLFFIQRPLTVGVCAKLLTRHEKSWPGSLTRGFLFEVGLQHLAEYLLDRVRGNSKLCKSGHVPRSDVIDLHEIDLIASHGRTREHL